MMQELLIGALSIEILYSFVIIICSLMIYFGTKELYELSTHRGLKYFRLAFLFFAIAYFFRSFIKFVLIYFDTSTIINLSPRIFDKIFGQLTLLIFMYFSSMAIFYLLNSVMWKKWDKKPGIIYLLHGTATLIALVSIYSKNPVTYLGLNILLFFFIAIVVVLAYKNKTKTAKHNLYLVYMLLFIFWILNIIDILIPNFLQAFQLLVYLASSTIFLLILYKVIKRTGVD